MYPQTLARPYAESIFSLASSDHCEDMWLLFLQQSAALMIQEEHHTLRSFLTDPRIAESVKSEVFITVYDKLGGYWGQGDVLQLQKSFISLLAENHRLILLPEISNHFSDFLAQQRGEFSVIIESAYPMLDDTVTSITQQLQKNFGVSLKPTVSHNSDLIGGFRAIVGDRVLDCSLKATLNKAHQSFVAL